jgi:hypothetical protein
MVASVLNTLVENKFTYCSKIICQIREMVVNSPPRERNTAEPVNFKNFHETEIYKKKKKI